MPLGYPAQKHVHVRDRQRPAASVAGRSRIGPRALGAHAELDAVEAADRAPAGSYGFDGHHRRDDSHARLFGVAFESAPPERLFTAEGRPYTRRAPGGG